MAEPIADLTGARAKLGRAKEHLGASDAEMQRLWEPHADKRFIQFSRDGEWHVVSVSPIFEFSPELSLIVGDFFNNLRAVLDHLVWQLVLREGKKPDERTQFPFFYSEEEFIKKVKSPPKKSEKYSPLHGIPVNGDAWAIIEKAQPWYNCKLYGFQPREDMLATVALLSNIDKHRTLLATQPFPDQTALSQTIVWNPSDAQPIEKRIALMPLSHEKPTNIDDMNPQIYGFLMERLFAEKAADVWFTPIQMKKNRPAIMLSVLGPSSLESKLSEIIMKETSTLGIRSRAVSRHMAHREIMEFDSSLGRAHAKIKRFGQDILAVSPEYDDCRQLAMEHNLPLHEVSRIVEIEARRYLAEHKTG